MNDKDGCLILISCFIFIMHIYNSPFLLMVRFLRYEIPIKSAVNADVQFINIQQSDFLILNKIVGYPSTKIPNDILSSLLIFTCQFKWLFKNTKSII
jgi:hypothetical protein